MTSPSPSIRATWLSSSMLPLNEVSQTRTTLSYKNCTLSMLSQGACESWRFLATSLVGRSQVLTSRLRSLPRRRGRSLTCLPRWKSTAAGRPLSTSSSRTRCTDSSPMQSNGILQSF